MTKVTLAVLEQRICCLKSTAQTEETQAEIKDLENQYQALEHKIQLRMMGGLEKIQSINRQMKAKQAQLRAQNQAKSKQEEEDKRRGGRGRFDKKEKKENTQSSGVPEKKENPKAFLTKCMKKNQKKHEARKRAKQVKARVLGLEEKFAREPSQRLANQIESLNKKVVERENRSMNDSLHNLKSLNPLELNSFQVKKLETLEKTLSERDALEEHQTQEPKKKKIQLGEVPNKYKVKKLKNRLKRLQVDKESLKEKHFKQPTAETKNAIEANDAKTQAIQSALDMALEKRAQFFSHPKKLSKKKTRKSL